MGIFSNSKKTDKTTLGFSILIKITFLLGWIYMIYKHIFRIFINQGGIEIKFCLVVSSLINDIKNFKNRNADM